MRVKRGVKRARERSRVLKKTEGFRGRYKNAITIARNALDRAMAFSYRDRKVLKRDMRQLWISRITAACRLRGFSYSKFIAALKTQKIDLDRKMLADLAATNPAVFDRIVDASKVQATLAKAS